MARPPSAQRRKPPCSARGVYLVLASPHSFEGGLTTYAEIARKLPKPTRGQMRAFAEFVSGAHSWYKHLSLRVPYPFVFYLDPNAGRDMVSVSDSQVRFVDRTEKSAKFHYTWDTTQAYRDRYGFWDYEASYGATFRYQTGEGVVDTAGPGLKVLAEGRWLPIPEDLMHRGTALVSAAMWNSTPEERIRCMFRVRWPFDRAEGLEELLRLEELLPSLPKGVAAALSDLLALWKRDDYEPERARAYHSFDEFCRKRSSASDGDLHEVYDRLYVQAKDAWSRTASGQAERTLVGQLGLSLERERQRQIDLMVTAMETFLAGLPM